MIDSEIKKWNDEGGYYKLMELEAKRGKKCLLLGIVSFILTILWFPILLILALWGMGTWSFFGPYPAWYNFLIDTALIFPGITSIGIFFYISRRLYPAKKPLTKMGKRGAFLASICALIHIFFFIFILLGF